MEFSISFGEKVLTASPVVAGWNRWDKSMSTCETLTGCEFGLWKMIRVRKDWCLMALSLKNT